MKFARPDRRLLAWVLLLCTLYGAWHCAVGHGQMLVMPAAHLADAHAHQPAQFADQASGHAHASVDSGCDFASPFGAIILAAFFGLLALLAVEAARQFPPSVVLRQPRCRWPPANPRAPPQRLSLL